MSPRILHHLNKLVYLEHVRALRDVQLVVRLQGSGVNMNQLDPML